MACGRLGGGVGELVKGSVGWESGVPTPLKVASTSEAAAGPRKKGGTGRPSGEGPVPAETQRVHPGVKEGDAERKSVPLGPTRGREEIES